MKRKNAFPFQFRIISVVLAILIMIMSLPVNALAEDNVFSHDNNEGYLAEQSAPEIFEVLTSRTLNSKTIHLADGSFYLATYNTDVHRITEDGSYAEIDNTLIKTNDGIINSDKNILLASEMKESQAVLTVFHSNEAHEEKSVSFTILGNVRPTKGRIENPEQKPDDDLAEYEKLTVLSKINSSVTYENVYKNTDIEYVLHGSDVKENIIVKDRCEEYTYAFALALSGFTAEKTDTGEIIINDSGTGETVYRIPAPVMWDSAFNSSSDIEVFINEVNPENIGQEYSEKTNAYVLSYTASSSWINDPSRSFPVTIDPPLYSSSSNIIDLDLTTQNPDRSSPSDNTVYAGREWRTYLKLTTLPTLPFLARITKAEITMTYFSSGADDPDGYLGVYNVTSDWNSSLTLNDVQDGTHGVPADNPADYRKFETDVTESGPVTWDITSIADNWYNGTNYGLMFQPVNASFSGTARFYSNDHSTSSVRPYLTVTYRNYTGLEDYLSYSSFSGGLAGDAYVNNATGNQVVTIPLLSTADSLMPLTPTLVFNYNLNFADYLYSSTGVQSGNKYTMTSKGFKLNLNETLISKTVTGGPGGSSVYYIWSDADGTEHYLRYTGSIDDEYYYVYEDEDGLGLTLEYYYEGDNRCELKDKNGNVRYFSECTAPSGVSSAYCLTSVIDRNGNRADISVNSRNAPTYLYLVPYNSDPDEEIRIQQLKFMYNSSGVLTCVYNPASGEGVILRYADSYGGNTGLYAKYYLRQVVRAHGGTTDTPWINFYNTNANNNYAGITVDSVSYYTYNYLGLITRMTDELSGTALCFNTYTSRRVSVVYENENNTLTDGQGIIFTYGKDYTNIQSSGKDDIIETNDDILTHYCFDHACRCVCSYSTDLTGHSVYGINSVEYEAEASARNNASDNSKKRNKVKSAAYVSDSTPNLLLNPTFKWTGSGDIPDWNKTAGVVLSSSARYFNLNPTGYDYRIKIPESSTASYVYQSLTLPAGTYTLSADVMCYEQNNLTARLKVTDGSGTATLGQKEIRGEETSDYSDVSLTSLTFIVPGNNTSVRVYLTVEGTSSYSNGDYVILKQMSLTGSAGSGLVSVVDYGNFDDSVHSGSSVASRWTSSVPGVPVQIVSDTDFGGKCLRMNGTGVNNTSIPGTTHYSDYTVSQVLYEATEDEYSHYCSNTSQYFLMQKQFRVTARAKASGAIPSDQSAFEIRLTFTLSTGSNSSGTETKTEKIPFSKYTDKWQYVSEIVEVPHGKFIRKITVECVFSNQYGYALFDDISVCFAGNDENSTRYIYCDNGNIKAITNGYATTWYIYGNGSHYAGENDVIAEIKPRYATIYTYSARHKVSQTHVYTYPTDYGAEENYGFNPDNTSGYTLRSTTEYTYNTFGQVTSTDTVIPAAGNAIDQRLSTSTTYNTPASASAPAAHIFGSVRQQTDDSGNVTEYFYDNGTGNVKAVLDPLGNGVCYEYDHLGRITSVRPCERSGSTYYEIYESAEVEYVYDGTDLRKIDTVSTDYYVTYDKFGNKTKVAFDESGTVKLAEYRYNGHNGKLYEVDYANGKRVKYLYDTLERVSEIQYNSGVNGAFVTAYKFNYDADGHLYLSEDLLTGTDTYRRYSYNGRLNEYASAVRTGANPQNVSSTTYTVLYDEEGRTQSVFGDRDYRSGSTTLTDSFSRTYGYDYDDGSLISATSNYSGLRYNQGYAYDYFGRITREESEITDEEGINYYERKQIKYEVVSSDGDDLTSTRISGVDTTYTGNASSGNFTKNYRYTYDANGNITEIRINNVLKYSYEYDEFGQLTRENNADTNQTVIYIYDNSGNIREKRTYTYTVASSLSGLEYTPVYYTYDEPEAYTDGYFEGLWGDLLTGYDGQEITYDNVGNPLTIGDGITLEWTQGRRLARYSLYGDTDIEFTYDADGIRTRKTVEGITHYYTLDGTKILSEEWTTGTGSNTCQHLMIYVYDAYGSPIGFRYRKSTEPEGVFHEYLYGKNIQGDILYVLGLNGTLYASYVYDAWGKQTVTYLNTGSNFANAPGVQYNPFTYRGYYYDSETGLYYLNSRYYNPEWGRFLNPDCYLNANGDIFGFNMFAYCGNNPVMGYDPSGEFPVLSVLIAAAVIAVCAACLTGCSSPTIIPDNDGEFENTPLNPKSKNCYHTYEDAVDALSCLIAEKTEESHCEYEYGSGIFQYANDDNFYFDSPVTFYSYQTVRYKFPEDVIPVALMHSHCSDYLSEPFAMDKLGRDNKNNRIDSFIIIPSDITKKNIKIYLLPKTATEIDQWRIYE